MTHILLYTDDPGEGGVQQYNHSILCRLTASGCRLTHVHGHNYNPLISREEKLGIQQIKLEFTTGQDRLRTYKDLAGPEKIFSTVRPDLIIFSDSWPLSNFAAKHAAINLKIPYVIVLGFIEESPANLSFIDGISSRDAVKYHYSQAKVGICVSEHNSKLLQNIYDIYPEKLKIIYYGRPTTYFQLPDLSVRQRLRQSLGIPQNGVICFTAARLAAVKGYQYQLQAIKKLKQSLVWQKLYFVWAGGGGSHKYQNREWEIKDAVQKLGVSDRVKFLGQCWNIPQWLDASDIFILPSEAEGMPMAVMEAMAKGLPVIASAVSGIPEELGNTGKLLPNPKIDPQGAVEQLAATIGEWATSPELRYQLGEACKRRAEKLFCEERMLDQYLETISWVLSQKDNNYKSNFSEVSDRIKLLESRLSYNSLVWEAWYAYYQGDIFKTVEKLRESLKYTPFLRAETWLNWVESFSRFSGDRGEKFDVYYFSKSPSWRELIQSILS